MSNLHNYYLIVIILIILSNNSNEYLSNAKLINSLFNSIFETSQQALPPPPPPPPPEEKIAYSCLGCIRDKPIMRTQQPERGSETDDKMWQQPQPQQPQRPYSVTTEQLTALRIEYIKHQILSKLKLNEAPKIAPLPLLLKQLPLPTLTDNMLLARNQQNNGDGNSDGDGDGDNDDDHFDDFYGKTAQAVFFAYNDDTKCHLKNRGSSVCLAFNITTDIRERDLRSAQLWLFKLRDRTGNRYNQTFVISELAHWDNQKSFPKINPIAIHETSSSSQDWIVVDVAIVVRKWLKHHDFLHKLSIECKTCSFGERVAAQQRTIAVTQGDFKPFLILKTYSSDTQRRQQHQQQQLQLQRMKMSPRFKRSSGSNGNGNGNSGTTSFNCVPGVNECCRETLHISFAEIGWDNWILSPSGYNAYFCHGSCSTAAAITLTEPNYNTILQKFLYGSPNISRRKLELIPCCAATQFKSLELTYANNRSSITKKILPNMIVDACGCM